VKWIVMLRTQSGNPTPMTNGDMQDTVALFDSEDEAMATAGDNPLGMTYGFEVYEWAGA